MISPKDILTAIFDTFDQSAIGDFRHFLLRNAQVKKWQIAADFCLHDNGHQNNVFAFSIIPYDDFHDVLSAEIRHAVPKDLKHTRDIQDKTKAFLVDIRRFHFGFVLEDAPEVFNNGPGSEPLQVARECLRLTLEAMQEHGRSKENVRGIKELIQKSQAKNFNVKLLSDMYVLSYFLCFVTLLLARERPVEIVGWLTDRDNMTTWCEGVIWDISRENLHGLAQHFNVPILKEMPLIAVPTPDAADGGMWFDEHIRLPDYIAGIFASWNFSTNELPGDKGKYKQLAEEVVADAKNMAILKIRFDDSFQASRIVFSKTPF